MFTLVADGAPPITINIGKGLAGACAQAKELVNVPDAYKDDRFNAAGEHVPSHTLLIHAPHPPSPSHPPLTHPCTLPLTSRPEERLRDALRAVRAHTQRARRGDRRHPSPQQLGLYRLLTTHYSLLTAHYPLLTTPCSPPTTHYPLLTTC